MLELAVLIGFLVWLVKFNASTRAVAQGAETKSQVWAEEVIMESTLQRADNYQAWEVAKKDKKIVSHDTFMKEMAGE